MNKYRVVFTDVNKETYLSSVVTAEDFKIVQQDAANKLSASNHIGFSDGRSVSSTHVVSFAVVLVEEGISDEQVQPGCADMDSSSGEGSEGRRPVPPEA